MKRVISIGFTGTRKGMTSRQKENLNEYLRKLKPRIAHHGDCRGSDAEFHELLERDFPDVRIHIHPPTREKDRAHCSGYFVHQPVGLLERNQVIVLAADFIIATPSGYKEQKRGSGTWYTIRQAKKTCVPLLILFPHGEIKKIGVCG